MLKDKISQSIQKLNSALLILENGQIFWGKGIGSQSESIGELCFNTSQTGYQEILTDPSYAKQIITFTFPHIGIVGTNEIDNESEKSEIKSFKRKRRELSKCATKTLNKHRGAIVLDFN